MGITVQEIIDRILTEIPGEPLEETVDTLKAGDPGAEVSAVVTTFSASVPVLRRAAELGANMVITHEPTFYSGSDEAAWLAGDAVHEAKRRLIEESGLAVWRFHDHWHRLRPDGIMTGVVRRLGWQQYAEADRPGRFTLPETTVAEVAGHAKERLGSASVRITGDADMKVTNVALLPGAPPSKVQMKALQESDVELAVCGESREWETYEYARDASALGLGKAAIFVGHCAAEEAGMEYLVEWLGALDLGGVPVTFVPAGDAFTAL
jgi:putative NIF3 family GTP cyclohydrolase 1 type 2